MKPLKKVTDLGENEVIHCKTEKEAKAICQLMHNAGLKWVRGDLYIESNNYDIYKKETCYEPKDGTYSGLKFYTELKYKIHPAKDFIQKVTKKEILNRIEKLEKDFKKFDAIATTMVDGTLKAIQIIKESENSPLTNMENGCNVVISGKEKLFPKELEKEAEKIFSNQIPIKPDYESFIGKKIVGFEFGNNNSFNLQCFNFGKIGQIEQYCAITNQFRVVFNNKGYGYFYPADLAIQHIVEDTTINLQVPVTDNEKEKVLLYLDMLEHARIVNGDWVPDWESLSQNKFGIRLYKKDISIIDYCLYVYCIFGIAYKDRQSAEQAKEKFSERILKYYGN